MFKNYVTFFFLLTALTFGAETNSAKTGPANDNKVPEVKIVGDSLEIYKSQLDSLKKNLSKKDELLKNDSTKIYRAQVDSLKKEIGKKDETLKKIDSLKIYKTQLESLKKDFDGKNELVQKQSYRLSQIDTLLVKVSTLSLYLPYDSISVETRAIPAYKLISDSALSKKHEVRLKLLESYRADVIEFQKFLEKMMGEFKSKKVSKNKADAFAKELKEQKFYKHNLKYNGNPEGTFMGNLFRETLEQLQRYSNENTADFYKVMLELDKCVGVGKN